MTVKITNYDTVRRKAYGTLEEELKNTELRPGESKTLKLVLTRKMTEENTDIVNNIAEIDEDYNVYGLSDYNSKPKNKIKNENDLEMADIVIMIKTGELFIYISVLITTILLMLIVIFTVYSALMLIKRRKDSFYKNCTSSS